MIDYQEIGNNIKICRIRCNLKQAELAEMVGVTSQHISHVERCQTKPSLTLVLQQCSQHITSVSFHAACKAAFFTWNLRHSDTVTY